MSGISKQNEPLPCPFCGSTVLKSGGDDKVVGFWCLTCEAAGPNHYGSHEWNDRAALSSRSAEAGNPVDADAVIERKFGLGDLVTKTKGSSWTGHVVGFYSTALTPVGYAVESETETGSVQIYPEAALAAAAPHPTKTEAVDADAVIERLTKALTKLEREASEVSKIGAKPGTQWTRLAGALINARSALAAQGEDAALKSGRSQP